MSVDTLAQTHRIGRHELTHPHYIMGGQRDKAADQHRIQQPVEHAVITRRTQSGMAICRWTNLTVYAHA